MALRREDPYQRLREMAGFEAPVPAPLTTPEEDALIQRQIANERRSESDRAFQQGLDNVRASGVAARGLLRSPFDEEGAMRDFQRAQEIQEEAAAMGPRVQSIEDIDGIGSGLEWARNVTLTQLPNLAVSAVGGLGGVGARVAGGTLARRAAQRGLARAAGASAAQRAGVDTVSEEMQRRAARHAARQMPARNIGREVAQGSALGGAAAGTALQSSVAPGIVLDEDPNNTASFAERAGTAAVGAAITGSLEALPVMALFRRFGLTGAADEVTGNVLARVSKQFAKQGTTEAATEVAQTMGERLAHKYVNDNIEVIGPEAYADYLNAAAGGFIGGGLFGAPAGLRGVGSNSEAGKKYAASMRDYMGRFKRKPGPDGGVPAPVPGQPMDDGPAGGAAGAAPGTVESVVRRAKEYTDRATAGVKGAGERIKKAGEELNAKFRENLDNLRGDDDASYSATEILDATALNTMMRDPDARKPKTAPKVDRYGLTPAMALVDANIIRDWREQGVPTRVAAAASMIPNEQQRHELLNSGALDEAGKALAGADPRELDDRLITRFQDALGPVGDKRRSAFNVVAKTAYDNRPRAEDIELPGEGLPADPAETRDPTKMSDDASYEERDTLDPERPLRTSEAEIERWKQKEGKPIPRGTPQGTLMFTGPDGIRRGMRGRTLGRWIVQARESDPVLAAQPEAIQLAEVLADMQLQGYQIEPDTLQAMSLNRDGSWKLAPATAKAIREGMAPSTRPSFAQRMAPENFRLEAPANWTPSSRPRDSAEQNRLNREPGLNEYTERQGAEDPSRLDDAQRILGPRRGSPQGLRASGGRLLGEGAEGNRKPQAPRTLRRLPAAPETAPQVSDIRLQEAQTTDSEVDQDLARMEREQYPIENDDFNDLDRIIERVTKQSIEDDFDRRRDLYNQARRELRRQATEARARFPQQRESAQQALAELEDAATRYGEAQYASALKAYQRNKNKTTYRRLQAARAAVTEFKRDLREARDTIPRELLREEQAPSVSREEGAAAREDVTERQESPGVGARPTRQGRSAKSVEKSRRKAAAATREAKRDRAERVRIERELAEEREDAAELGATDDVVQRAIDKAFEDSDVNFSAPLNNDTVDAEADTNQPPSFDSTTETASERLYRSSEAASEAVRTARDSVRELLSQLNFKFEESPNLNLTDLERIASKYLTGLHNDDPRFLSDAAKALSYALYTDINEGRAVNIRRSVIEKALGEWLATGKPPRVEKSIWSAILESLNRLLSVFQSTGFRTAETALEDTVRKIATGADFSYKPKPGYARLNFQREIDNNPLAAQVLDSLRASGVKFALTGSVAYADQVPVYRKKDSPLHDVDLLVQDVDAARAFLEQDTDNWGDTGQLYEFDPAGGRVVGMALVPAGHEIRNLKSFWNVKENNPQRSYDVYETATGKKVGSYFFLRGREERFEGVAGVTVDLISDAGRARLPQEYRAPNGERVTIDVVSYVGGFAAKLEMLRPKDVADFKAVVPPERTPRDADSNQSPESDFSAPLNNDTVDAEIARYTGMRSKAGFGALIERILASNLPDTAKSKLHSKVVAARDALHAETMQAGVRQYQRMGIEKALPMDENHLQEFSAALRTTGAYDVGGTTLDRALMAVRGMANPEQKKLIDTLVKTGVARHARIMTTTLSRVPAIRGVHQLREGDSFVSLDIPPHSYNGYSVDGVYILLHEAIHAATALAERRNPESRKAVGIMLAHARRQAELMGIDPGTFYGLGETQEFLAEVFTNPELQAMLAQMPAANTKKFQSLWHEFKDFVRKLVGLPRADATLLDEVLAVGLDMARETRDRREDAIAEMFAGVEANASPTSMIATPAAGAQPSDYFRFMTPDNRRYFEALFRRGDVFRRIKAALPESMHDALHSADEGPRLLVNTGLALAMTNQLDVKAGPVRELFDIISRIIQVPTQAAYGRTLLMNLRERGGVTRRGLRADAQELTLTAPAAAVTKFVNARIAPAVRAFATDMNQRMRTTGVPALTQLATLISQRTGEFRSDRKSSYAARQLAERNRRMNDFYKIIGGWSDEKKKAVGQLLRSKDTAPMHAEVKPGVFEDVQPDAEKVRAFYRDMRGYLVETGVLGRDQGLEDYFPVAMDHEAVAENRDAFIRLFSAPNIAGAARERDRLLLKRKRAQTTDERTKRLYDRRLAEISRMSDQQVAESWYAFASSPNPTPHVAGLTFAEGDVDPSFRPGNQRLMDFVYNNGTPEQLAEFEKFQDQNFERVTVTYIGRATKRGEWSRLRLGPTIEKLLRDADAQGATPAQLRMAKDYIDQTMGSYGQDWHPWIARIADSFGINLPEFAKFQSVQRGLVTYQNLRLLPLALMSSLIDPLGVAVRTGGSVSKSFAGYRDAVRALRNEGGNDALRALAEDMGLIERHAVSEALIYMYGTAADPNALSSRINAQLFKWNGLEYVTKFSRLAALSAGRRFLMKHAAGDSETSKRYLNELNLKPADVVVRNGELVRSPKIDAALLQFVDEAVVRPTPHQRPGWHNDPHFQLAAQYKGYLYSFWNTVARRGAVELGNGNPAVLAPLALYVPIQAMGEVARDALQGDDDDRDWQDYAWLGVERSGLLGPKVNIVQSARQDLQYRSSIMNSVIGPTGQQLSQAYDALSGERGLMRTTREALPLSALHEDWGTGPVITEEKTNG